MRIKIIGVGTIGSKIANEFINFSSAVEPIAIDTSVSDLRTSKVEKLQIGRTIAKGLPATDHYKGTRAAEESKSDIKNFISNSDVNIIVSAFGRGTGTGATPVIAEISHQNRITTICVILKPLPFESYEKQKITEDIIKELKPLTNTLISIPPDRIIEMSQNQGLRISIVDQFEIAKKFIYEFIKGLLSPLLCGSIHSGSFINFFKDAGDVYPSMVLNQSKTRVKLLLENALKSPLLRDINVSAAGKIYVSIGCDLSEVPMETFIEITNYFSKLVNGPEKVTSGFYDEKTKWINLLLLVGKLSNKKIHPIKKEKFLIDETFHIPAYKRIKLKKLK